MTLDQYSVAALRAVHRPEDILLCLQILLDKINPESTTGDHLLSACLALEEDLNNPVVLLTPPNQNFQQWQAETVKGAQS